jgi:hypothetical protein
MSYIGNIPTTVAFLVDTFSGNGSTTAFTLSQAPATTSSILVAVSGVVQDPSTYSVSGTTLTFSGAPPSGTSNISVRFLGIPASGVATTAYRTLTTFTATSGQTTFSVPSYTVGYIDVYRNGVKLGTADFTATSGTSVVLASGATAGDLVETISFFVSSVLNAIPAVAGAVNSNYIANDVTINFADGSASTPSITNNGDTNTGIFFPAADSIAFAEGGSEIARFDSSGNLLVGTTSASGFDSGADNLIVGGGSGNTGMTIYSGTTGVGTINFADGTSGSAIFAGGVNYNHTNNLMSFYTDTGTGRMTIASDGAISAGSTSSTVGLGVWSNFGSRIIDFARYADDGSIVGFRRGATVVGTISVTGSATAYNTSSDYRLKENIAPLTGALTIVQALKPCTYTWKADGSDGQGFIAHELAEVVPQAVTGEKDALDKDGNPEYQGIDVSFLVATLTAAIQELKAEVDSLKAEVTALKGTE